MFSCRKKKFLNHLKTLFHLAEEGTIAIPFNVTIPHLITLDTGEVKDPAIIVCLQKAHCISKDMFTEFVSSRIEKAAKSLSDVTKNFKLFSFTNRPPTDVKNGAVGSAKWNTTLVTKLFISLQARPEANISEFFNHKNQREPPSLSHEGKLRSGT